MYRRPAEETTLGKLLTKAFAPDVAIGTRGNRASVYKPDALMPLRETRVTINSDSNAPWREADAYADEALPWSDDDEDESDGDDGAPTRPRGGITGANLEVRHAPARSAYRGRLQQLAKAAGPAVATAFANGYVMSKSIDLSKLKQESVRIESLNELLAGYRLSFLAYRRRTPHLTLLADWNVRLAPPPGFLAPLYAPTLSMATPSAGVDAAYDYRYDADARPNAPRAKRSEWVAPVRTQTREATGAHVVLDLFSEPLDRTLQAGLEARARLPLDELTLWLRGALFQIAQGLRAAFVERGAVHHDLHANNVMLVKRPVALKRADWLLYFDRPVKPRLHVRDDRGSDADDRTVRYRARRRETQTRPLLDLQPHGPAGRGPQRSRLPFGSRRAREERALRATPPPVPGANWADETEWHELLQGTEKYGAAGVGGSMFSTGGNIAKKKKTDTTPVSPPDASPMAQMYALPVPDEVVKIIDFGRTRLLANASDAQPLRASVLTGLGETYKDLGISTGTPDPTHDMRLLAWSLVTRVLPPALWETPLPAGREAQDLRGRLLDFLGTALGGVGLAEVLAGYREEDAGYTPEEAAIKGRIGVYLDRGLFVNWRSLPVQIEALNRARLLLTDTVQTAARALLAEAKLDEVEKNAADADLTPAAFASAQWTPAHNAALVALLARVTRAPRPTDETPDIPLKTYWAHEYLHAAIREALVYENYITFPPSRFRDGTPLSAGVAAVHALLHPLFDELAVTSEARADALLQLERKFAPVVGLPPRDELLHDDELVATDPALPTPTMAPGIGAPFLQRHAHATMPRTPTAPQTPHAGAPHLLATQEYMDELRQRAANDPAGDRSRRPTIAKRIAVARARRNGFGRGPRCTWCGDHGARFACTGCHQESYCSPSCQRLAWTLGCHDLVCAQMSTL